MITQAKTHKKILYFDLENTLIKHWKDQRLCWERNNKLFLNKIKPDKIGIFSFALWCDENINTFIYDGMLSMIEQEYGINISNDQIIHVNEMVSCYNDTNEKPNSENKELYFINWIYCNTDRLKEYNEIWLIDDTVDSKTIIEEDFSINFENPTKNNNTECGM